MTMCDHLLANCFFLFVNVMKPVFKRYGTKQNKAVLNANCSAPNDRHSYQHIVKHEQATPKVKQSLTKTVS